MYHIVHLMEIFFCRDLCSSVYLPDIRHPAGETPNSSEQINNRDSYIHVGRATIIKHPYHGETPSQMFVPSESISIPVDSVDTANRMIRRANAVASSGGSFKTTLTRLYQQMFHRSEAIPVKGMQFQGKQYLVDIGKKVPGKVISDPNFTELKLALLDILPSIVTNSEYVGSGQYISEGKKGNTAIRYDYFETPVSYGNKDYIARFDVEVLPMANNYRTHQIVEIHLHEK